MSLGDFPNYVLPISPGVGVVYLVVTVGATSRAINSVSIGSGASLPADGVSTFHALIGSYTDQPGGTLTATDNLAGSLWFELCGGVEPLWGAV
jgi:hypothetical protein